MNRDDDDDDLPAAPLYFDRDGQPMQLAEWCARFEDLEYKRVAFDQITSYAFVSTVWLGLDHGYGQGPPVIFESMTNVDGEWDWQNRYATIEEARSGHAVMVGQLRAHLRARTWRRIGFAAAVVVIAAALARGASCIMNL